jgi:ribosomal-protein-alanine N-acetyltransferase
MPVTLKNPDVVAPPVAFYSHLAVVPANARLLVLAGQVGNRADGNFAESMEDQFAQALANVLAIVRSEGGDAASIARLTYVVERPSTRTGLSDAMSAAFGGAFPAMTFIYVAGLFAPHVKVEIEAIAAL